MPLIFLVKGKIGRVAVVFLGRDHLEEADDLSDCDSETWTDVCAVLDVTVVLVSSSSVVTECLGDVSWHSDWEFVEPQSSSFSKKRAFVWAVSQEEVRHESSPAKAPPLSRRRMMPPAPQQSSHSPIEDGQWQIEVDQMWNARDRTVIARTKYLEKSLSMEVEVKELESQLDPEDSEVDFRRILEEARNKVARSLRPSVQRVRVNCW